MMIHMMWVILSFFAVVGLLYCILGVLEMLSLRRVQSVGQTFFRVELAGEETHVEYLLNTLLLKSEQLNVGSHETVLEIVDKGLSPTARGEVLRYCEKNPWVLFTEPTDNDII